MAKKAVVEEVVLNPLQQIEKAVDTLVQKRVVSLDGFLKLKK